MPLFTLDLTEGTHF